jgi:hypothetical protein
VIAQYVPSKAIAFLVEKCDRTKRLTITMPNDDRTFSDLRSPQAYRRSPPSQHLLSSQEIAG